jgi:hypothetical protein
LSQQEMVDSYSPNTEEQSIVFNANTGSLKKETSDKSLLHKGNLTNKRVLKSEDIIFNRD